MAEIKDVSLVLTQEGLFNVKAAVTYSVDFTREEVSGRDRFRVSIELYGDDSEEGGSQVWFQRPLYVFQFQRSLFLPATDYRVIAAKNPSPPDTESVILTRLTLDEDSGTDEIVFHRRPAPGIPKSESSNEIVINVPRVDEVYAVVKLSPYTSSTARSAAVDVPGSGGIRRFF